MFIDDLIESQMEPAHYAELGFSAKRSFISREDKGISVKRQFKAAQSLVFENKLFSNWVAIDIRKHLCQARRFLKLL